MSATKPAARTSPQAGPTMSSSGRPDLAVIETTIPSFRDLIRECDDAESPLSNDDLTDRVINRLRDMGEEGWVVIRSVLRSEVTTTRTKPTRMREGSIQRHYEPGDGTMPAISAVRKLSLEQLRQFVGQQVTIRLENGERGIRLGETLTISDWNMRAHELERVAAQAFAKVELYRSVANTLKSLGVRTISEALTPERKRGK